jgi:hypothetical protein
VAKGARRKYRQREEPVIISRSERRDLGEGGLRYVELAMQEKAVKDFLDRQAQNGELDPVHRNGAVDEIAYVVVRTDRERESDLRHVRVEMSSP